MELLVRIVEHGIMSVGANFVYPGPNHGGYPPTVDLVMHLIGMTGIFISIAILGFLSWVAANRMRQRIKRDLGKTVFESDLTSMETWMKVDEAEQKKHPGHEWAPGSSVSDYPSSKRDL